MGIIDEMESVNRACRAAVIEPCAICREKAWSTWAEREAVAGRALPQVARACEECKRKMAAWWGKQA